MKSVLYNSKSEEFKKPFGAVSTEKEVVFNIHILKNENVSDVDFVCRRDNETEPFYTHMQKNGEYDCYDIFSCSVEFDKPDLYFYRFELKCDYGIKFVGLKNGEACIEDWLPEWQLTVYSKDFHTPEWVKGGIMYQIFPDRFAKSEKYKPDYSPNPRKIHENWYDIPDFIYDNPDYKANDYFMGNADGVIEKLDYLKSLGVTVIYFNPVFESPEYHRYSTANYLNIDPYFGTNERFALLLKKCKEAGIQVIIDGVFSHTGADSIYFNKYNHYNSEGAYNSENSPYYAWYNFIDYPEKYECWWGFENLPNVSETNPSYMEYITGENGVLKFWQDMGVKGWRLDVADELPDEFLDNLYTRVKTVDSDAFVIGEVWEDATNKFAYGVRRRYLLGGQMDSVMNYPWRTAILDFVKDGNSQLFNDRLLSVMENYPPEVLNCLMNSISTHDTPRAINCLGVEHDVPDNEKGTYKLTCEEYEKGRSLLISATFLQFTLPGIPSIYYGDEAGLCGFRDPYSRMGYPYGREDNIILDFYKKIAGVRTQYKEDFKAPFNLYYMQKGVYSFRRGQLICAVNVSDCEKTFEIEIKEIIFSYGDCSYEDNKLSLKGRGCAILKL